MNWLSFFAVEIIAGIIVFSAQEETFN